MKALKKLNGKNPELRFICLSGYQQKNKYKTISLLHKKFDWDKLIYLAERHRMISHVYNNIAQIKEFIPVHPFEKIQRKCEQNRLKLIRLAGTLIEITTAFKENKVPVVVLKGPLMAEQFYGDIGMKQSRDIDLLVNWENIQLCERILKDFNCLRIQPSFTLSPKQTEVHHNIIHHYTYINKKNNTIIELHWRLLSPKTLMPVNTATIIEHSVKMKWEKRTFSIPNDVDQLIYLAAHGAKHQWYRLYWLKDFAEALHIFPEPQYKILIYKAKEYGLINPLIQGILLSNILFDYELPDSFIPLVSKNHYQLAKSALKKIRISEKRNLSRKINRLSKLIYTMRLRNDLKYKWDCIWSSRTVENDWIILPLPDRLFFLYYFLRPFLWFYDVYIKRQ